MDGGLCWCIFVVLFYFSKPLWSLELEHGDIVFKVVSWVEKWDIPLLLHSCPQLSHGSEKCRVLVTGTHSRIHHRTHGTCEKQTLMLWSAAWVTKHEVFALRSFLMGLPLQVAALKGHPGVRCLLCTVLSTELLQGQGDLLSSDCLQKWYGWWGMSWGPSNLKLRSCPVMQRLIKAPGLFLKRCWLGERFSLQLGRVWALLFLFLNVFFY